MNIKDIDKISTSPRKGKKGFLKKLLDLTKGGGESDDKTLTITNIVRRTFENKTKEEAMSLLNLDEDSFDKLYSNYYDKLLYKTNSVNRSLFKTYEVKDENNNMISVSYVSVTFEDRGIGGYSSYTFDYDGDNSYGMIVDEV